METKIVRNLIEIGQIIGRRYIDIVEKGDYWHIVFDIGPLTDGEMDQLIHRGALIGDGCLILCLPKEDDLPDGYTQALTEQEKAVLLKSAQKSEEEQAEARRTIEAEWKQRMK